MQINCKKVFAELFSKSDIASPHPQNKTSGETKMEQLLKILSSLHPEVDFENTEDLVDDGILDSLDIVAIVTEIDAEMGVSIPAEEIVPENFNSVKALMELIERLDEE